MNPFKLFDPSYLFDPTPGYTFLYFWPLIVFFLLVFTGSFYIKKYFKMLPNHDVAMEFLGGVPRRMREFAISGIILAIFRNEDIPYFAIRFWTVLIFVLAVAYGIYVWNGYKKNINTRVVRRQEERITDKYLPKPKKKHKNKR